jgi:hypothetical protein
MRSSSTGKKDLQDPVKRDFVGRGGFGALLSERGIGNDDTVILYGGNNNWFAAYAYWYFKVYGHQDVGFWMSATEEYLANNALRGDLLRPAAVAAVASGRGRGLHGRPAQRVCHPRAERG